MCAAAAAAGAAAAIAVLPHLSPADGLDPAARQKLVEQAILANPKIIPDAISRLQQMEVEKLLASNRRAIETPYAGAWAGAADADAVIVEFFDFNCPFCRQSSADIERLLAEDRRLKVVFRDMPVLGPESERFARASLAAATQGPDSYLRFYRSVFGGQGSLGQERLIRSVRAARLDERKVAAALESREVAAEIDRNLGLGRALGLTGTPSYVIGNRILSGAVGYEALKQAVAEARARPK
jgi:protein-disulfide isomerase